MTNVRMMGEREFLEYIDQLLDPAKAGSEEDAREAIKERLDYYAEVRAAHGARKRKGDGQ